MTEDLEKFSNFAKDSAKNPLGIITLFIVLVYGFSTLTVIFAENLGDNIILLLYFLISFPFIVFTGFLWLVSKHSDKMYGPSDFKDETNFLKMKMTATATLIAAMMNRTDKNLNGSQINQDQINDIVELILKTSLTKKSSAIKEWENRVLWVDDRPENNVYVRKALEAQGIKFSIALSTQDAVEMLENNKYAAIISDMGRKEGPQEGYVLLKKLRQAGNNTPFFIFAGSNSLEHKRMAKEKGAQGSTNDPQELFELIMRVINQ